MASSMTAIKRFILWDFPRAGWQYDVMVGVILVFIFATPREWFRDQPRASSIVMLPSERGSTVFWIDAEQFASISESERTSQAGVLLKERIGKAYKILGLDPILDSEKGI